MDRPTTPNLPYQVTMVVSIFADDETRATERAWKLAERLRDEPDVPNVNVERVD